MNEMHIFDLSNFINNPSNLDVRIECKAIKTKSGTLPSTRWGHAAASHYNKLFIIGGRNEKDVSDIHEFDFESQSWKEHVASGTLPLPRRRHSALFIGGSIV